MVEYVEQNGTLGVATKVGISQKTVEYHIAEAMSLLGLVGTIELVRWVVQNNLVKPLTLKVKLKPEPTGLSCTKAGQVIHRATLAA